MPVRDVFEGDDPPRVIERRDEVVALYKPSGIATHRATPDVPDLVAFANESLEGDGWAPIHRLDRGTSGVVLLSNDPDTRRRVSAHFESGSVSKRYLALVAGQARKKGIIRRALPDRRRDKPLPAITRYRLSALFQITAKRSFSLVVARPETGRRHQIRRHFAGIGHPIVGDDRYQKRPVPVPGFPGRLWLHAEELALPDWTISCPLPALLSAHLELLDERSARAETG